MQHALMGLLSSLALLACSKSPDTPTYPSLLLITIDTLRADHLGTYGYFRNTSPRLDRFAEHALVFEHAVSAIATTLPSHVSILTSTYPARHGVLANFHAFFHQPLVTDDSLQTAAQMLHAQHYATAAFTSAAPLAAATGINAGFETFEGPAFETMGTKQDQLRAAATIDRAIGWLRNAPRPFFLWVHLFDPHSPYDPPSPYDQTFRDGPELEAFMQARKIPSAFHLLANRYDGEILYTDHHLGRLFDELEKRGLLDSIAIVVVGDHGEGLMQHQVREHGELWNEQLFVPLIMRLPDGPRGRRKEIASLIDILPTLADEIGLPLQRGQLEGINLLRETRETALSQRTMGKRRPKPNLALTGHTWKLVHFTDEPDRLFALEHDPYELHDMIRARPDIAKKMRQEIRRIVQRDQALIPLRRKELPAEIRQRIKALGYVE